MSAQVDDHTAVIGAEAGGRLWLPPLTDGAVQAGVAGEVHGPHHVGDSARRAITSGRLSNMPLCTVRASS